MANPQVTVEINTLFNSQGTRRFLSFALTLAAATAVTVVGIFKSVDLIALSGPLTTIAAIGAAAIGFGNAHDAKVRTAAIGAFDPMTRKEGGTP